MQRHEMIAAMAGPGLKGMAGGFDDAVTTKDQPGRTITKILSRPAGVRCLLKIDYYDRKTEFG
jgi:hypothetical protein